MDPLEFHKVADFLKSSPEEANIRTSINRSYYGTFLYFREYLASKGITKRIQPKNSAHVFVRSAFGYSETVIGSKLASMLSDLEQRRHNADYELNGSYGPSDSEDALRIAKDAISDYVTNITPDEEVKLLENAVAHVKSKNWM